MNTFFISDTHFGHKSILKYEPEHRPFQTLEEMHEVMINLWNSVVRPKDKVIHLGDFSFGEKGLEVAAHLNGVKYLVLGNHDMLSTEKYLKYFHKVLGCLEFDGNICTHIPVHESQFYRYTHNLHGHLHSSYIGKGGGIMRPEDAHWDIKPDPRYINVSCEQQNLTPKPYEVIKKEFIL
jgi:calcineurin-like phosphoesterase family protein